MFARASESNSRSGHANRRRRLQMQPLQSRRCLAYADLELRILEDDSDGPGAPIPDSILESGQSYWLEIRVQENHPFQRGLRTVATNVDWDASLMDVIESDFSPETQVSERLPDWRGGDLDNATGSITDLRGRNGGSALTHEFLGDGQLESFMQFRITAERSGRGTIDLSPSRFAISPERAASWSNKQISFGSLSYEIVEAAPTQIADFDSTTEDVSITLAEPTSPSLLAVAADTVVSENVVEPIRVSDEEPLTASESETDSIGDDNGETTLEHELCTVVLLGVPNQAAQEHSVADLGSFVFIAPLEAMGPLLPDDLVRVVQTAIPWADWSIHDEDESESLF
ncbi:MAG: hypothetical protein AAGD07_07150 [Planctomycetota bacterium]